MKNNCILIKEIREEQVTSGGIIIPVEKYNRKALVIKSDVPEIKPGDIVIKAIGRGTLFNINGESYEVINDSHVLGISENY